MLTNMKSIVDEAYRGGYAVGSFNGYNYETFKGIVDAGIETHTAIILAFGEKYLSNMSLKSATALCKSLGEDAPVPVCLHLDHCKDIEVIYRAVQAGFGSVMYDGSALSFAENLDNTKRVCEVAHACGVSVEAELGSLAAGEKSHEGSAEDEQRYTDPDAAKQFVQETQVDALAVSVGTVHGLYKGKPDIRIDILSAINEKLQIPLVLHGGSGVPEQDILDCISNGIAKINVNTEISVFAVDKTLGYLSRQQPHFSVLSLAQIDFVKEVVMKYIAFFRKSA